ncbi:NAD(P)/FAD-dependent oxidoreductase [Xanthomonas graminis]|uniref:Oxidoreductase n=1 Tax=Xanthomonas graminis pv. phlei TaxID=487906 RepID=A0A0K2ZU40_9XANT|nr:FAD-dependent oxidoreductase [Xanthomonas translucens]UKE67473.1 FAD-binding oxidoreductase [Xanthomonas translucens pv. phlei]UKE71496.1 FAD-binding oxidoreductase [Xanthomonas translucens pv. phleipratensis]CTP86925.1 oxidoreductase [Xanthomonas translucens pv. phlei]
MDLKSGYPFWSVRNGLMQSFPQLHSDLRCDVAIVGGGITAALIADELIAHGHDVAVLEQRDIGWGSTSASTALLQYEIDTHMLDLAKRYGEDAAALAYRSCAQALKQLRALVRPLRDVDFGWNDSLYYASRRRHVRVLQQELQLRARHGLDVEWLDAQALRSDYGVEAYGAILSHQAARVDPYRLTYRLLGRALKRGAGVYDRTRITDIQVHGRGATLRTEQGVQVRAAHVVMAAGYASQAWLDQHVARNRSSYAFVSDPLDAAQLGALKDTMVWESARPYLYLRSTGNGRIVAGGEDDSVDIPLRRDARVDGKARKLCRKIAKAMPGLEVQPTFAWAGTFAETADGLPFFGPHPQHGPRMQFAMAYGGNGITYSMLGAGLLRAQIERRAHPLKQLFGFARLD